MQTDLIKLSDRVFILPGSADTDRPSLGLITGSKQNLLIDAGNSPAHVECLRQALSRAQSAEPRLLFLTHWHWDHTFGASALDLLTLSSEATYFELSKQKELEWSVQALDHRVRNGSEIPFCAEMMKKEYGRELESINIRLPDILFSGKLTLDLGDVTVVLEHIGGSHSSDSSIAYVVEEKILFLGDCLGPDLYHGKWHYNMDALFAMLEKIQNYDAETYIDSHSDPEEKNLFHRHIHEMRVTAEAVKKYDCDYDLIMREIAHRLERAVTPDDEELVRYFIYSSG